jgi:flagellar hook-associated protein 2
MASTGAITTTTTNVTGSVFLDGIASGIDTTSMINQLAEARQRPITSLQTRKASLQAKLGIYQTITASLANLRLAAVNLSAASDFRLNTATVSGFSAAAGAPLAASADSTAQAGSYRVTVEQLASAQKIRSGTVASQTEALGLEGSILINGKSITLEADDTLQSLRSAIGDAGAGVTATIIKVSAGDYRLTLTADETGVGNAIDLVDASASGVLTTLGLTASATTTKHAVTNGVQSDGLASSALEVAQTLGLVMPPAGTVMISGKAVAMDFSTDSLTDIATRINATEGMTATASVVSEEVDGVQSFRLQITGEGGAPELQDGGGALRALGILTSAPAHQIQAAADARITVDGVPVTRATNSMDDVIAGVSIELTHLDPDASLTLTVAADTADVTSRIRTFVTAYNDVVARINSASDYDVEAETGGVLFGDNTTLNLEHGLRSAVMGLVALSPSRSNTLAALGITTGSNDTLVLDADKLQAALADDPDAAASLFGLTATASNVGVQYISSGSRAADSGPAGYAIHIAQVATRATAISADLSAGITTDETLTFSGGPSVTLTAGMSLQEAADALNGWLSTNTSPYQATVTDGRLQIAHEQYGAKYSLAIASSVAHGGGGTNLGAAEAGQTATYSGQDVAGTINGEQCTGRGQYLAAADSNPNTAGVTLRITATTTGDLGTIALTEGAAKRLSDYLDLSLDATDGAMTRGAESLSTGITAVDEDIARLQEGIQTYTDLLRTKFTAMESAIAKANNLQSYITGQLTALNKTSN